MLRAVDTLRLADLRRRLTTLNGDLGERRRFARDTLIAFGRPDATWRLTEVESWLTASAGQLEDRIDAVRLASWLQAEPGSGNAAPRPVIAWDAVYSTLGPEIAAAYLGGLSDGEQQLIARWRPSAIAGLHGAPLAARIEANQKLIDLEIDRVEATISGVQASLEDYPVESGAHRWRAVQIEALREQQEILRRLGERNPVWFEAGEDGRFMEWIGPRDSEHIVVFVPGTGHSLWTADDLFATATRMQEAATGIGSESSAVVVAMGYDAPNTIPSAGFSSYAEHGGPELARIVDSLGISPDRHVTLIGHSYGSYVATRGLSELQVLEVDDLVLVGSPGVGVESVSDIPIDPANVWAGLTDNDSITLTSSDRWLTWLERIDLNPFDWKTWDVKRDGTYERLWFGTNPAHPTFGAQRLEMYQADGHSGYFGGNERDHAALENLARVFVGLDPVLDE